MSEVRLRFAPSPTGYLHIGGLRTALYNYLYARQKGGKFILRIEDTDRDRFVEGALENLIESLNWAGIDYDEGVYLEDGEIVQRGGDDSYIQSERLDIYQKYVDQLIEEGHAYYCFCTRERLDNLREEQRMNSMVPKYDGLCRGLSLEEAKEKIANGEEYVVRLKWPKNHDVTFTDLVRGKITINSDDSDDQILLKSDGFPTYHMAVVVDDHLMGITHIVRGDEWVSSTPKHVYLYEAFDWPQPIYVHLPTVLNKDKQKLSKRHGDVSVDDFEARGYLPEGLINYLALVGWSPESNQEILSMDELIEQFSFDRVAKTGGVFDKDKLDWVNAHYMRELSIEELTERSIPYLEEAGLMTEEEVRENEEWVHLLLKTVQESLHKMDEVVDRVSFAFEDELNIEDEEVLEVLKGETVPELLDAIEKELESVEEIDMEYASGFMKKIQEETGIKGKNLFMPSRVAITGAARGPEFVNVLVLLGRDKVLSKVKQAKDKYI